jgi:hypothetical protein
MHQTKPETTYLVSDMRIDALRERIEKLSRKATKLGGQPFQLVTDQSHMVEKNGLAMTYWTVSLQGGSEIPVIKGWRFMARLQHLPSGNLIKTVPGTLEDGQDVPETYRTRRSCDHCQTNRRRKDTYLLQHIHTQAWKQVGSTCIKDFTGHENPEALINAYTCLLDAIDGLDDERGFDPFDQADCYEAGHLHAGAFLSYVLGEIRYCGWVSSGATKEDPTLYPTWMAGLAAMKDHRSIKKPPMPADFEQAEDCLVWIRNTLAHRDRLNDYEHNLVTALAGDWLIYDVLPLAASAVITWKRALEQEREAAASTSQFYGEKGKRYKFLVLTMQYHWASEPKAWGISHLHKLTDAAGNVFIWWTGRKACQEDTTYLVTGTVKDHQEYQGIKQTILTRCKVEEVSELAPEQQTLGV